MIGIFSGTTLATADVATGGNTTNPIPKNMPMTRITILLLPIYAETQIAQEN
jgi:hypothetical protein